MGEIPAHTDFPPTTMPRPHSEPVEPVRRGMVTNKLQNKQVPHSEFAFDRRFGHIGVWDRRKLSCEIPDTAFGLTRGSINGYDTPARRRE